MLLLRVHRRAASWLLLREGGHVGGTELLLRVLIAARPLIKWLVMLLLWGESGRRVGLLRVWQRHNTQDVSCNLDTRQIWNLDNN